MSTTWTVTPSDKSRRRRPPGRLLHVDHAARYHLSLLHQHGRCPLGRGQRTSTKQLVHARLKEVMQRLGRAHQASESAGIAASHDASSRRVEVDVAGLLWVVCVETESDAVALREMSRPRVVVWCASRWVEGGEDIFVKDAEESQMLENWESYVGEE